MSISAVGTPGRRFWPPYWARIVLKRALLRVCNEFEAAGKAAQFQSMKVF
jgi:hypothetical protein